MLPRYTGELNCRPFSWAVDSEVLRKQGFILRFKFPCILTSHSLLTNLESPLNNSDLPSSLKPERGFFQRGNYICSFHFPCPFEYGLSARFYKLDRMAKLWWLLVLACTIASCRSQDEVPRSAFGFDQDYYEPGRTTEDCVCVPVYLCIDGEVVDDGSNILDPRKRPQKEELPLENNYEPPECGPFHVCCRDPETTPIRPYTHRCGTRNPGGVNGRVVSTAGY
ncbi:u18-Deinotoxin-Dsu1a_1 [Caerostris darwini]|uniref:U18-Deinotoxin-Dsu1a_1 n=1 Tax=Caerostris darwini TaxID=1538125 RepID=A0AAV4QS53_9ARAC|nr:u18-Deinotoxin-Dsu1a_1 [Caerostris darwini]